MREGVEDTTPDKKWYVFDGPVDAVWVESMNTLLDDNKKLCLSSGEIIKMTHCQTMMFEVGDLAFASPATVSRCGMIYMEPGALGLSPLVKSWITQETSRLNAIFHLDFKGVIEKLCENYIESSLEFMRKNLKEAVPTTNSNLVSSLFNILQSLLLPYHLNAITNTSLSEDPELFQNVLEPYFIFSLIWSIGATSDGDGRKKFNSWLKGQLKAKSSNIIFPDDGFCYDYFYDVENRSWVNWMSKTSEAFVVNTKTNPGEVIVPTVDTIRNSFVLELLLSNGFHVLCTGPTGTGKSVTIQDKLMHGMASNITPITINFSARTSANQTQDLIDSKLEKRRKGVFGPPAGKRYIIFIDDLNMPQLDICNSQPPIELIRQWMDCSGWYDRKNIGKFMEILDITFVTAMGPPGGGRNPVTNRLTRHFNLLSFVEMENSSLQRIFSTIMSAFLEKFSSEIAAKIDSLVSASIHIYNTIRSELLPTPAKSHYTFNLRDLAKVIQGVLAADIKTVVQDVDITRLWIHECMRVFQDRLVDKTDKTWFKELVNATLSSHLSLAWTDVVSVEPILYGDYMIPGADPKIYSEIKVILNLFTF
jgi:dynein heavy chain